MQFDFDTPVRRDGTDSQKWQKYAGRDVLPLWVADMDFRAPPAAIDALRTRIDHGVFGYARPVKSTVDAVVGAMERRYHWRISPEWIVWLPGLVCGLNLVSEAYAQAGEEILSLTPVYPPFLTGPKYRGRVSVGVPLVPPRRGEGKPEWKIDWGALERALTPKTRLFFFCHPHNPIARVWERAELERVVDFCTRHRLVLCSDEIHCDLVLDPARRHIPAASLSAEAAARTITLMAPSKTYNLPGLGTSFAVIPDPALRTRLVEAARGIVPEVTAPGYAACEAAYRDSEPWRLELLSYLRGNRDLLADFVARNLPGVGIEAPIEATYLAWLNVESLGMEDPAAHFEKHGVGLVDGAAFGEPRGRHVRLNFGCPRSTLDEALRRLSSAVAARAGSS